MSKVLTLPTTGRAYRLSARNVVIEALAFYLQQIELGNIFYIPVFRDVAYANLDAYPKQVGPFLRRAQHSVPNGEFL